MVAVSGIVYTFEAAGAAAEKVTVAAIRDAWRCIAVLLLQLKLRALVNAAAPVTYSKNHNNSCIAIATGIIERLL